MPDPYKKTLLTKSRFTHCLDCPTKLYYQAHKGEYRSTMDDNDFLQSLAKGGIQVGELAKLYYPGGVEVESLDYEESLAETAELLEQEGEEVIIYEAALKHEQYFVRVDILVKKDRHIQLIEVKSKSWEPGDSFISSRDGTILSGDQKYLYDVAFQFRVAEQVFPGYQIEPFLMLIDKSVPATKEGLHQHFKVVDEDGRFRIEVKPGTTAADIGRPIMKAVPVMVEVDMILEGKGRDPKSAAEAAGFDAWVQALARHLQYDQKYPVDIGEKCKKCEYRIGRDKLKAGEKSGFEECWSKALGWSAEEFEKPHVFDIWNERGMQKKYLDHEVYLMEELLPPEGSGGMGMLPSPPGLVYLQTEWNNDERKTVQILKSTGADDPGEVLLDDYAAEAEIWSWPLHFIDFEAVLAAIPFHKGLYPYDYVPFQFSCHTVYEDGRVVHRADWIETEPGKMPCIAFVRKLRECLLEDKGTVFRYHTFENTVLNKMADLIRRYEPEDQEELLAFIVTLVKGGEREMVDLWELVKKYYYSVHMGGSISIKDVLPAVLTESRFLQEKYSKPYSGLYIKDKVFYKPDPETGKAISPYNLLDPVGHGIPGYEEGDSVLDEDTISEGGSAMMAWSRLQFEDVSPADREAILHSLYQYCELDTLAMVMIWEHFSFISRES